MIEVILEECVDGGKKIRRISYVIDGKNYGVAFNKIPSLEEIGDLYPCVELCNQGDSVEIME